MHKIQIKIGNSKCRKTVPAGSFHCPVLIEVDGGIDRMTAPIAREAGAGVLVAGTSVFRAPDVKEAIEALKQPVKA